MARTESFQLNIAANMLARGYYDDLATCFSENGVNQEINITLPYGFTLGIENPRRVGELAWDAYSMGAMTSLLENCGALLVNIGRIETEQIKLLKFLILFGKDIGFQVFFCIAPELVESGDLGNILGMLNCKDDSDLSELAIEALNSQLFSMSNIPVAIYPMQQIVEVYQNLVGMNYIRNMLILKRKDGSWEYTAENSDLAEHRWIDKYNRAMKLGRADICERMMEIRRLRESGY